MKYFFKNILLMLLMLAGCTVRAQLLDSASLAAEPVYNDLTEALKDSSKVYRLDLHRKKLKEIPAGVFKLTNLQELNLSKNKLTKLPKEIAKLTKLQVLDVSSNDIDTLCPEIGKLLNIQQLILNQNVIASLPSSIGNLTRMYFLDMWGNEIQSFPKEITKLKNTLKVIDLRVISIKEPDQEDMVEMLPNTKILFSMSCNCH
jgi:Leucine-rich repeat (LRR) protein